jgi:collagenase-like PrtC family protease
MMLNVAANFEDEYLDELSKYPEVRVVFGRLATDFVGGGCESALLKDISRQRLQSYVQRAKEKGIAFNYVINSPSVNNEEHSSHGKGELNRLLEFLSSLDLESVTIANPFLVLYIKRNFPNLRTKASANFAIDSLEKARYVRNMGIDILVLDPLLINRDFAALRAIRQALGDEIEILVNNNCLMNCPFLETGSDRRTSRRTKGLAIHGSR